MITNFYFKLSDVEEDYFLCSADLGRRMMFRGEAQLNSDTEPPSGLPAWNQGHSKGRPESYNVPSNKYQVLYTLGRSFTYYH